ncbi:MAG: DUF6273 domain-containing protein, partial [Oscillospiraceae bacterium]|nr:DUF6273 domain-containing protein [Oscillospiraceae bacterium]
MRTSRIGRGMTKVISMVLAFAMVMGGIFVWSDVEAQALGTATVMELNGTEVTSDAINFPAVGQTFTDSSGMAWRVLHEDAAGNRLIITEFVHTFAQYNTVRAWLPLAQAPIRTVLDNWVLATEVAASALTPVGAGHDVRFTVGNFDPAENEAAGRTLAGEPIPVADASNGLFLLSISEVNQYFANDETRIAFYAGLTVVPTYWWLRSPGGVGAQAEAVVVQYRPVAISTQIASTTHGGVRPALWVDGGEVGCPCDTYPCDCCDDCGTYPCDCCDTCGTYPCDCCDTCGTYPCDCCDTCGTYPCDCCDTCGTYPCDCCDTCGTYPCDCCDICGTYPCDCGPGGCNCGEPGGCDCGEPGGCDCGEPGGCDCGEPGGCDCGEPGG